MALESRSGAGVRPVRTADGLAAYAKITPTTEILARRAELQRQLDSYLDARPDEHRTVGRALLAEELAIFVWQWPAFATYNSATEIDRVRRRTRDLAERWFDTRS